jgi:hypothetical protein
MKTVAFVALLLSATLCNANVVGYVNLNFPVGDTLFGNMFDDGSGNLLSQVIPSPPDQTAIYIWTPSTQSFSQAAVFSTATSTWSANPEMTPGKGFKLHTSTAFMNTFVGSVLAPDGSPWNGQNPVPLPAVNTSSGVFLLACRTPFNLPYIGLGLSVFPAIIGRDAVYGDQFSWMDSAQQIHITRCIAGKVDEGWEEWDNGEPALPLGQAAFFAINGAVMLIPYAGGTGTAVDPFQIQSAEQLNSIGVKTGDWNKCFVLTSDIDLSGYTGTEYKIIGSDAHPFTGTFDGNGHVISNLTYVTTSAVDYVGLFGYVSGGTIQNLCLKNVNLSTNGNWVGAVAGHKEGTVRACSSTGSVHGNWAVGGLVGNSETGSIENCWSAAAVSSSGAYTGGLVGRYWSGTISRCYSTGTVTGASYVAGFAGWNYGGSFNGCFWNTQTSGLSSGVASGSSTGLAGQTTSQMKALSTFTSAGWDFASTWAMPMGEYPALFLRKAGDLNLDASVNMLDLAILAQNWLAP